MAATLNQHDCNNQGVRSVLQKAHDCLPAYFAQLVRFRLKADSFEPTVSTFSREGWCYQARA